MRDMKRAPRVLLAVDSDNKSMKVSESRFAFFGLLLYDRGMDGSRYGCRRI